MVGNVTIQGQIVGTATFDGAKISAVVTVAPPINATVIFGRSGVTVHNLLTGRDDIDAHQKESITGLTIADSPEFANTQITTLDSVDNGGIIPNAEATWLGATAKSVLSYLQKLVSKVYAIDGRVYAIENNVIFDITTTEDVLSFVITTDIKGNAINLTDGQYRLQRLSYNGSVALANNVVTFFINDINTDVYSQSFASANYWGINHRGGTFYNEVTLILNLKNGVLTWQGLSTGTNAKDAYSSTIIQGYSIKSLITINAITKLTVKDILGLQPIKAGTRFRLIKI